MLLFAGQEHDLAQRTEVAGENRGNANAKLDKLEEATLVRRGSTANVPR